ncbi:hypothetical protein SLEP1_g9406 [Rubroshorea leprosula]|uniref:Uncharacterized protein n=1 Tax=Rubroshorea leprosula TaxID=152421 RepID=A0AAV5ID82_9ROSI|nr:hypothetical protein SLEP1_g9406 [Rubroshorea leprosula]
MTRKWHEHLKLKSINKQIKLKISKPRGENSFIATKYTHQT